MAVKIWNEGVNIVLRRRAEDCLKDLSVTDQVAKPPLTRQGPIRGPGRIPGALHGCVGLLRVESIGGDRGRD